jgi:Fic family protein
LTSPIDVAAFCLWRLNWIHPFKNGNGRCAPAFTYACLCLKFGFMLPGAPTVIELIMNDRDPYEAALRDADQKLVANKVVDTSQMEAVLEGLLMKQLGSIPTGAA